MILVFFVSLYFSEIIATTYIFRDVFMLMLLMIQMLIALNSDADLVDSDAENG